MNKKKVVLWMVAVLSIYTGVVVYALHERQDNALDITIVNDIAQSLAEQWNELDQVELPGLSYGLDYVVLDHENHYKGATREGLSMDLNSAIRNRDTIVDILSDQTVLGKLIIANNIGDTWNQYRSDLLLISEGIILFVVGFCLIYLLYLDKSIFMPFRRLREFAAHIAAGNLDMPLPMDKGNRFGAFTESFDLMREELHKARVNERLANQSKKELVASLSHDVKTPVSSIMAVAEVMLAKSEDESQKKQLQIITAKAEQINTLITNMFTATLEELQELKVSVTEQPSNRIYDLIKEADYNNHITYIKTAEGIVLMDELRLAQVIDNVISNAYKYADTSILVSVDIIGQYLEVTFRDFGAGVFDEEIPLIFNKFYRASNSKGKNGVGLGLYISKHLMNQMSGDMECSNREDGFTVKLSLLIA